MNGKTHMRRRRGGLSQSGQHIDWQSWTSVVQGEEPDEAQAKPSWAQEEEEGEESAAKEGLGTLPTPPAGQVFLQRKNLQERTFLT